VYRHAIVIVMENKSYDAVIGSSDAPFFNRLATQCGVATNYHGVAHPSLPNYIALTSGSTHGITDNEPPSVHPLRGASLYTQVRATKREWRNYEESAPGNCALASSGRYAVKHDPAPYYVQARKDCARWDVPLGSVGRGSLSRAIATDSLPAFALVTPDLCSDTHDCPVATGDQWLAAWIPPLLRSRAYRSGTTAIFVVWDEDDGGDSNHVPMLAVAPSIAAGTRAPARFDHYSLLRTTEQILGIRTYLGNASRAASMRRALQM
jgi:phosphatidylinositol-3-phosphatase